jgi:type I restriction enzyme S subunit
MEIMDSGQQITVGNRPNAFHSFPDNWQMCSLGEITTSSQYGISSSLGGNYSVPILKMNNLQDGHIDLRDLDYIQLSKAEMESLMLNKGDLLINRTNSPDLVGKAAIYDLAGEYVFASYLVRFRLGPSVLPAFVNYFLNSEPGQRKLKLLATKAVSQANINPSILKRRLFVPIPPLPEQRAIAAALSEVDTLITSLDRLIAKKRDIKQATMQQLLTGKTRLPGFSEEWEVKNLEEITMCLDNLRVPLNDEQRSKIKGDYPYCGANGVLDYVADYVIDDDIILIAEDGGYFDEYAYRPIAYRMVGKCWVNNHAHILKAKEHIDQNFVYYSLVHKNILRFLASGTRAKLNKSEMYKIEINIPKSKSEQKAIADILTDMDAEIAALEQKRDKTRALKQGMMQELLTGKTRLI